MGWEWPFIFFLSFSGLLTLYYSANFHAEKSNYIVYGRYTTHLYGIACSKKHSTLTNLITNFCLFQGQVPPPLPLAGAHESMTVNNQN